MLKEIKRERYLSKIRPFYEQDLIKVITGIRRCGKSILLTQVIKELKDNMIQDNQIIYINFEFEKFSKLNNDKNLYKYVVEKMVNINKYKYYLFFDEIQNVAKWEKLINSFKAEYGEKVSIFITGSNSDLLSGELATHLAGRYVSFKINPFSFKEVCELTGKIDLNKYDLEADFFDYVKWGGLPQRFAQTDELRTITYLSDVFDSIVVKDIIERFSIKDLDLLNRVIEYIVTTPSQTFSAENLSDYFLKNDKRNVSKETLYNYLEYMSIALLINKVNRYDVRGKRILNGKYKYYLTDLGLGQIKSVNKREQMGAYLENIVYNELVIRGYNVNVGNLVDGEIDFIATRYNEKIYIQVAYILADEGVIEREFGAYKSIEDNFPKYVITMDKVEQSQNGIIHKNIVDWLLEE